MIRPHRTRKTSPFWIVVGLFVEEAAIPLFAITFLSAFICGGIFGMWDTETGSAVIFTDFSETKTRLIFVPLEDWGEFDGTYIGETSPEHPGMGYENIDTFPGYQKRQTAERKLLRRVFFHGPNPEAFFTEYEVSPDEFRRALSQEAVLIRCGYVRPIQPIFAEQVPRKSK